VLWLLSLYVLYWAIRLGVQHGVEARDRQRDSLTQSERDDTRNNT
jgi:hypothetical protein